MRCRHRNLRIFSFADGQVIQTCRDCTRFDKKRREILTTAVRVKSVAESERQIPEGRLGNYLVWKYLSFPAERAETFERLVGYCFKAAKNHVLYLRPMRYEEAFDRKLDADIRYRMAKEQVMRSMIEIALAEFLSEQGKLSIVERNQKNLEGWFGVVSTNVLNRIRDERDKRKALKRQEPEMVPREIVLEWENRFISEEVDSGS